MDISKRLAIIAAVGLLSVISITVFSLTDFSDDRVPNCWDKSEDCSYEELEKTYLSCNDWYISHPEEDLDCEWTEEDVGKVALVTDPGNHVRGPVTEEEFDVEFHGVDVIGQQDLEFLPSGELIIGDQNGRVHLGDKDGIDAVFELDEVVDNEEVLEDSNTGVKGLAVDPDYDQNSRIFIYYTMSNSEDRGFEAETDHSSWHHRVSSFTITEDSLELENKMIDIEGAYWHTGGGVEVGPDGKLYVTVGDAREPRWTHSLDSHRGKTLRINLDGTVPQDNPFDNSYVYTLGHRNHQGISWDPETGNAWSAEHGEVRNDEINVLESGQNYGWGIEYSCGVEMDDSIDTADEQIKEPVRCYDNWTMAPSRTEFVDDEAHVWHGDMFVAGLRGKHLRRYDVQGEEIVEEELFYFNEESPDKTGVARRLRDVEFHDGSLWLIGDIGREEPASGLIQITPR